MATSKDLHNWKYVLLKKIDFSTQVSDARKANEQSSNNSKFNYPSASNLFLPKKISDIFERELAKASKLSRPPVSTNPIKRSILNFFGDKSVKLVCMISMPFILFWGVGAIFHVQLDYLVKVKHTRLYIQSVARI